jgi:hypothetical protein
MSINSRRRWMLGHPFLGAAIFCAALALPTAVIAFVGSDGKLAVAAATALGGWVLGTVVMGVAMSRAES